MERYVVTKDLLAVHLEVTCTIWPSIMEAEPGQTPRDVTGRAV